MADSWLSLASPCQRAALMRSFAMAPTSKQQEARHMLNAPPSPVSEADAAARVAAVIRALLTRADDGYRVGDGHPAEGVNGRQEQR